MGLKLSMLEEVRKFVAANFESGSITTTEFPLLPGGVRVVDQIGEELLFYYDTLTEEVKWVEPERGNN